MAPERTSSLHPAVSGSDDSRAQCRPGPGPGSGSECRVHWSIRSLTRGTQQLRQIPLRDPLVRKAVGNATQSSKLINSDYFRWPHFRLATVALSSVGIDSLRAAARQAHRRRSQDVSVDAGFLRGHQNQQLQSSAALTGILAANVQVGHGALV